LDERDKRGPLNPHQEKRKETVGNPAESDLNEEKGVRFSSGKNHVTSPCVVGGRKKESEY